jgi:hypothetical protein
MSGADCGVNGSTVRLSGYKRRHDPGSEGTRRSPRTGVAGDLAAIMAEIVAQLAENLRAVRCY